MAQDEFPPLRNPLPIPTCRLIRVINLPLRKEQGHDTQPKIVLLDVCLPSTARNLQHPMITFEENGRSVTRMYEVAKIFSGRVSAEKYARENGIKDVIFDNERPEMSKEKVADCHVIRTIDVPLTKKPNVPKDRKIALLNTCLKDETPQQRPVIEIVRNGKKEFREYEVLRVFADLKEAIDFAAEQGIKDFDIECEL